MGGGIGLPQFESADHGHQLLGLALESAGGGGHLFHQVPTLDGKVLLKIPAETQTGKSFRLRGKGVKPVRGGAVGDLICKVQIETPVNLTAEQKTLVENLGESLSNSGKHHSPQESSWLDSLKHFFTKG